MKALQINFLLNNFFVLWKRRGLMPIDLCALGLLFLLGLTLYTLTLAEYKQQVTGQEK